jgi:hypothetical protein
MLECKSEQRVNIKFLVKLKKSATETFQLLTEGYGEESAVEVSNISKTKKNKQMLFEVQSHVDYFLRYPGCCNGKVGSQRRDGNQQCYLEVLMKLRERVRRKRPELWRNGLL